MTREEILKVANPILFNAEDVRAILDGRKTVTRRVIKPQPPEEMPDNHNICRMPLFTSNGIRDLWYMDVLESYSFKQTRYFEQFAPYSKGDYLYIRETWSEWTDGYVYRAWTSPFPQPGRYSDEMMRWYPSIHMPKEAARIFLRVTDVRVERLQEITGRECVKEGIPESSLLEMGDDFTIGQFHDLWDSTIKPKDRDKYGWDANPWIFVIEFEREEVE